MAAVFPLDTSTPWIFNGVTYEYDASEDRWFVVSTTATDSVVDSLDTLTRGLEDANETIDREIDNRTDLINAAAGRNNAQDAAIAELDARVDSISSNIGILEFKGIYTYRLERSEAACNSAYVACVQAANETETYLTSVMLLWRSAKRKSVIRWQMARLHQLER